MAVVSSWCRSAQACMFVLAHLPGLTAGSAAGARSLTPVTPGRGHAGRRTSFSAPSPRGHSNYDDDSSSDGDVNEVRFFLNSRTGVAECPASRVTTID